jgi:hypothetical protein
VACALYVAQVMKRAAKEEKATLEQCAKLVGGCVATAHTVHALSTARSALLSLMARRCVCVCVCVCCRYMDDKFGQETARGDKFSRMAHVYVDNTMRSVLPIMPGQAYKPVPWGDTPILLFEASGHPMQSLEHTQLLRPNIIHYQDPRVNLKMDGFKNLFAEDPPAARAHQFFLADDAVVKVVAENTCRILKEHGW